jgi:hypothetical protein
VKTLLKVVGVILVCLVLLLVVSRITVVISPTRRPGR